MQEGEEKTVIPDASINCRVKSRRGSVFIDAPRFVMEVLSPSTEKNDNPKYFLWETITETNKEELRIIHFPNIRITFDELFDEVELD